MKRVCALLSLSFTSFAILNGQIVINEIRASDGHIELQNLGGSAVNITNYWFCSEGFYFALSTPNAVVCGSLNLAAGALVQINTNFEDNAPLLNATEGNMALYVNSSFVPCVIGDGMNMIDYVEWGFFGHTRSDIAVCEGLWTDGDFVASWTGCESIEYDGSGDSSSDWDPQNNATMDCMTNTSDGCAMMPLEILTFQVVQVADNAEIRWTGIHDPTATQVILEHSRDEYTWESMTTWIPRGPQLDKGEYCHKNPGAGLHFYRLKIFYLEGTEELSPISALWMSYERNKISFWPNPATERIEVFVHLVHPVPELEYRVLDAHGSELLRLRGPQHLELDLSDLPHGVYFIQIPLVPLTQRFIKSY